MAARFKDSRVTVRGSSLFWRFFMTTASVFLICLIVVGSALLILVSKYWIDEKTALLRKNANAVAGNTVDVLGSEYMNVNSRSSVMIICNNLNQISNAIAADIFIANPEGDVVYCKEILKSGFSLYTDPCMVHSGYKISEAEMKKALAGNCSGTGNLGGCLNDLSFIVSSPVTINGKTIAVVFATQSLVDGLAPYILAITKMFFLAALFGLFFAGVTSYFVTSRTTRPLRLMSAAAKSYANGDFSYRIPEKKSLLRTGRNEINDLISAFNSMAQALGDLEMSRRSFVANVSHELKTPMTTIGGFIDGILDGTIGDDKRNQYLGIVSGEVKRLSRLVTGMLNMSKIESGEFRLNPTMFDISDMIVTTLLSFEQIIDSRGIEIRGLEEITQNNIIADRDMINQVVYNLIDNAVKFTPDGGYIDVTSKSDTEKIIVRITNSGKGIAPDEIDKIFERFYKVDKSRSYDTKGAGMGLYIVKTIVELHGGSIKASSVEGEKTDFIFWLPKN